MTDTRPARIWPTVGIFAVCCMWAASATANYWAGSQYGTDDATKLLWGGTSLASDIAKTVILFAIVWAISSRQWVVVAVAALAFGLCVTWSLRSATMFAAIQIQTKYSERKHQTELIKDRRELLKLRTQRAAYLSQQEIKLPGSGRPLREAIVAERERTAQEFKSQIEAAEKQLGELEKSDVVPLVDPIAATFGVSERWVYQVTSLAFAILVELVSSTGFWIIAAARQKSGAQKVLSKETSARERDFCSTQPDDPERTPPGPPRASIHDYRRRPGTTRPNVQSDLSRAQIRREVEARYEPHSDGNLIWGEVFREVVESIPALGLDGCRPQSAPEHIRADLLEALGDLGGRKLKRGGYVRIAGIRRRSDYAYGRPISSPWFPERAEMGRA